MRVLGSVFDETVRQGAMVGRDSHPRPDTVTQFCSRASACVRSATSELRHHTASQPQRKGSSSAVRAHTGHPNVPREAPPTRVSQAGVKPRYGAVSEGRAS